MRISELSRLSGVSIPSIKYYLREGLLAPGASTGSNQADYGDAHLTRLRLIRALVDVGGLSIAAAREVLSAVDNPDLPLGWVFGVAQSSVSSSEFFSAHPSDRARARIEKLVDDHRWTVTPKNPGLTGAANVIDSFEAIEHPELLEIIDDYARAAEIVARADLRAVATQTDVSAMAETVVAGTVLGDAMFIALRRIAQEHITFELYPHPESADFFGRHPRHTSTHSESKPQP